MKASAARMVIDVDVDIDSLEPSIGVDIQISSGFEFLGSQRGILASWLRKVADDVEGSSSE